MTEALSPDHEDKFVGCLLGMMGDDPTAFANPANTLTQQIIQNNGLNENIGVVGSGMNAPAMIQSLPIGLLYVYGPFDKVSFIAQIEHISHQATDNPLAIQAAVLFAAAVRLIVRGELVPEDLISAAIDYLPLGDIFNPLRQRLLVVQDYLEERQTVIDNLVAYGDDPALRLTKVDRRNATRLKDADPVLQTVAATFYTYAAQYDSFEQGLKLAQQAGNAAGTVSGGLLGAHGGMAAISAQIVDEASVTALGKHLHSIARERAKL